MLIDNFMSLENIEKYKNLYKIYNNNSSKEFNEIILYILENQCQSYFTSILNKHNNEYTEECCNEMILDLSLGYLKKAIQYLYEHKNNNDNNLLKLYAIAYIKTYCYFLVDINYNHFDKCNYEQINILFNDENENNEFIRNMIVIYILRLYCKKFENFELFQSFNLEERNFNICSKILKKSKDNDIKYIFRESFIANKKYIDIYKKLSIEINKFIINETINESILTEINQNFDFYYCVLVNKYLSFL